MIQHFTMRLQHFTTVSEIQKLHFGKCFVSTGDQQVDTRTQRGEMEAALTPILLGFGLNFFGSVNMMMSGSRLHVC